MPALEDQKTKNGHINYSPLFFSHIAIISNKTVEIMALSI